METIASITRIAGTLKTAQGIRAVGENITGTVFALVLVGYLAITTAKSIVTVAHSVQAYSVLTLAAVFRTVVCYTKQHF